VRKLRPEKEQEPGQRVIRRQQLLLSTALSDTAEEDVLLSNTGFEIMQLLVPHQHSSIMCDLETLLSLAEPQFAHLQNGGNNTTCLTGLF
jgi:hypothetical protein